MDMNSEEKYIEERKHKAEELSDLFLSMQKYPIDSKKVVFSSFEGDGGFSCNPKYIAEALHRIMPECEMVWLTKDVSKEFPNYIQPAEYSEKNIAYHLSTAKIWIDNYRKPFGTLKREGQIYIQTWHASVGFKAVGLYRGENFPRIARLVSEWDSNLIDYVISNSDYCDQIYPKKLLYNGPTLRTGFPREDCLINDRDKLHIDIRSDLKLSQDVKLIMFAPTFRGGTEKEKKNVKAMMPSIDFNRLIDTLQGKFGGQWKILMRLHPQLAAKLDAMPIMNEDERLIDVSKYDDMCQILAGCDAVITDYSSCAFDAAFAGIPVFIYADDIDEYVKSRGQFMWKREELPFSISEDNDALIEQINGFDCHVYMDSVKAFTEKHGIEENGDASEKIAKWLAERMI